jgi:hypothetical protein
VEEAFLKAELLSTFRYVKRFLTLSVKVHLLLNCTYFLVFDSTKHRVEGTEAAQYVAKAKREEVKQAKQATTKGNQETPLKGDKKAKWKKEHEALMQMLKRERGRD